ncbi:MAG: hypothetical protein CR988_07475 [Treponema sp.]|nr:MAG: hypothetical protein CR988_07475 [Treponema sp.]
MKNSNLNKIIVAMILLAFLSSCATQKIKSHPVQPFGVIGSDADLYMYLPVKNNKIFIDALLGDMAEDKYIQMAIDKTDVIHSGFFQKRSDTAVRVCANGTYPAGLTDVIFKQSYGWKKKTTVDNHEYYESYDLDVSIPHPKFAFLVMGEKKAGDMDMTLANISNPDAPDFSPDFNKFISLGEKNGVALFSANPNFIISKLLGTDLGLPVKTIEVYFFNQKDDEIYTYSFIAKTGNKGTTAALAMILSRMLDGEIKIEDYLVKVENGKISYADLAYLLKEVY